MDTTKLSLLGLLFVIRCISFLMLYIIWSYLRNKAPAMQTLRDEMMKELIISLIPLMSIRDLLHFGFSPISKEFALFISYTRLAFAQYFFMQVLIVTLVRYLIIFHGPLIDSIEDQIVVNFARLFSFIWVFNTCLYTVLSEDITKYPDFLEMTGQLESLKIMDTHNSFFTLNLIVVLDIIVIVFVYGRIEIYKKRDQNYDFTSYNFGTIRTLVGISITCGLLFIVRINITWFNANIKNSIEKLIFHIIVQLLCVNIVPVLMILSNEKIIIYVKTKFMWFNIINAVNPI